MTFMELAKNRYSERFFDPRPVEQEKLDQMTDEIRAYIDQEKESRAAWQNPGDRYYRNYNSGEQDATIAATTMMYAAEELGVHNVWLRGFDSKAVVDAFGLPEHIIPVMMFAMGYPSERAKPNAWHFKRMPLENFVTEL